jgi:hypothetical protein
MPGKTSENLQSRLEHEFQRLTAKLGLNIDLKVVWMPDKTASLSDEVKDGSIYIYEAKRKKQSKPLSMN